MKKIIMLSVIGVFTLSSFNVVNIKKVEVELQTWYYSCNGGSTTSGTFLMPKGSSQADALVIARQLCAQQ
jgi:hypothetical protein